jgi:predicted DNA-binding transcriptional regulator AlpA
MLDEQSMSLNGQISRLIAQLIAASRAPNPSGGERLLRWPEVSKKVPYSHSTVYALMQKDLFPKAKSLGGGRGVAWSEREIDLWIASREIAAPPPPNHVTRKRRSAKPAKEQVAD